MHDNPICSDISILHRIENPLILNNTHQFSEFHQSNHHFFPPNPPKCPVWSHPRHLANSKSFSANPLMVSKISDLQTVFQRTHQKPNFRRPNTHGRGDRRAQPLRQHPPLQLQWQQQVVREKGRRAPVSLPPSPSSLYPFVQI